jgi:hypothetical protein
MSINKKKKKKNKLLKKNNLYRIKIYKKNYIFNKTIKNMNKTNNIMKLHFWNKSNK